MNPFPEEYELIDLFESEPKKLDDQVPYFYNNNVFTLMRSNGIVYFEIEPGSHWSRFLWKQDGKTIIDLTLEYIKVLEIEKRNGGEYLHIYFHEEQQLKPLVIKTKPEISIVWGTSSE